MRLIWPLRTGSNDVSYWCIHQNTPNGAYGNWVRLRLMPTGVRLVVKGTQIWEPNRDWYFNV